jgi:hypothetical protein
MFLPEWGAVSASSTQWLSTAKNWLKECTTHHHRCRLEPVGGYPSRLIYLGDSNAELRLVEMKPKSTQYLYAALSYVWGDDQTYTLTKGTLAAMTGALDTPRIPHAVRDAVEVARGLGLSYLWVDSLCIIQDPVPGPANGESDKTKEMRKMGDIYRNSAVTIVASSTSKCAESFLVPAAPPSFTVKPFDIPFRLGDTNSAPITLAYRVLGPTSADPINQRAWPLQERVLSTRVLSFSSHGIMWSCNTIDINPSAGRHAPPPFGDDRALKTGISELDPAWNIKDWWYRVRANYAQRSLTDPSDRLTAISSLAAEVATKTRDNYIAGHWQSDLFDELHWYVDKGANGRKPKQADAPYVAPSWSWASIGTAAHVCDTSYYNDGRVQYPGFRVEAVEVKPADPHFPFGAVLSGSLRVVGSVLLASWKPSKDKLWDVELIWNASADGGEGEEGWSFGEGIMDRNQVWEDGNRTVMCLAVSSVKTQMGTMFVQGLLLMGARNGAVRRVGFFESRNYSLLSDNGVTLELELV